jgi:hypothetical protein
LLDDRDDDGDKEGDDEAGDRIFVLGEIPPWIIASKAAMECIL